MKKEREGKEEEEKLNKKWLLRVARNSKLFWVIY
jgi:hypothetical protein